LKLAKDNESVLKEITLAEIPEMVYNSNAIENPTLSLEDKEKILAGGSLGRKVNVRGKGLLFCDKLKIEF
jgi:hypothetical protein